MLKPPELVGRNRLAASRLVFILGMIAVRDIKLYGLFKFDSATTSWETSPSTGGDLPFVVVVLSWPSHQVGFNCSSNLCLRSWWAISRPLNQSVTFALLPLSKKRRKLRNFVCVTFLFQGETYFKLEPGFASYDYLCAFASADTETCQSPSTGKPVVPALGWISTRSRPISSARSIAASVSIILTCAPSAPINRTCGTAISPFTLFFLLSAAICWTSYLCLTLRVRLVLLEHTKRQRSPSNLLLAQSTCNYKVINPTLNRL